MATGSARSMTNSTVRMSCLCSRPLTATMPDSSWQDAEALEAEHLQSAFTSMLQYLQALGYAFHEAELAVRTPTGSEVFARVETVTEASV